MTESDFRPVGDDAPGPFVQGTRCHQLAMLVVYESPLQVLCDSPYNYRASPAGMDFINVVPTTWDESHVFQGMPGEYIVMARRSGDDWYVGAMTNSETRTVQLRLDFLADSNFDTQIYQDAPDSKNFPEHLHQENTTLSAKDILTINMAPGGGYAAALQATR